MTLLADNRIARHRYFVTDTFEAGISLKGTEVKSAKAGRIQLRDSFVRIMRGEAWLLNCHIAPYDQGNIMNHEPTRTRKLLMHKAEIKRLIGQGEQKGMTLVPLKMYLKRGLVKVEFGLCKGKELHDKRETMKKRDSQREIARALRGRE